MRTRSRKTGPLVVVAVVVVTVVLVVIGIVAGPSLYRAARGGDDTSVTTITTDRVEAPVGELDGTWTVVPGSEPNRTTAGYTVDEILNGEPVTVVGSTDEVTGRVEITGSTLTSGTVDVRVGGLVTDNSARDDRARSSEILDAQAHPVATLALTGDVDLAGVPRDGTTATIPVPVELTIKGTTVSATVDVEVLRSGERLLASGAIPVTWSEVGVQAPSLGFVTVAESGTVDFLVVMEHTGTGGA